MSSTKNQAITHIKIEFLNDLLGKLDDLSIRALAIKI